MSDFKIRKCYRCHDPYGTDIMHFTCIDRPTTASSVRSQLWSLDRIIYEARHEKEMEEFSDRPYMKHKYPDLPKHYPGTWRVAKASVLCDIVSRLVKPTAASKARERDTRVQLTYLKLMREDDEKKDVKLRPNKKSPSGLSNKAPRIQIVDTVM